MSKLVHLCLTCGPPEAHHKPTQAAFISCRCCRTTPTNVDPEPTLRPTFDARTHEPELLMRPGTVQNGHHPAVAERLCACAHCEAAYDAQVGA